MYKCRVISYLLLKQLVFALYGLYDSIPLCLINDVKYHSLLLSRMVFVYSIICFMIAKFVKGSLS